MLLKSTFVLRMIGVVLLALCGHNLTIAIVLTSCTKSSASLQHLLCFFTESLLIHCLGTLSPRIDSKRYAWFIWYHAITMSKFMYMLPQATRSVYFFIIENRLPRSLRTRSVEAWILIAGFSRLVIKNLSANCRLLIAIIQVLESVVTRIFLLLYRPNLPCIF